MTYVPADPIPDVGLHRGSRTRSGELPGLPPAARLVENGRTALWAALRALSLGPGDRLVLPSYVCDSILPALEAAGVEPRYVATDQALRLQPDELAGEVASGAKAVLIVHYFGFPAPDFEATAALCRRLGASLVEDCAHALYSCSDGQTLGQRGDAAIFSPWKSLPLPDGGALVLNGPVGCDLEQLPRPSAALTARRVAYRAISALESGIGHSPRLLLLRSWALRRRMQSSAASAPLVPRRSSQLAERVIRNTSWREVVARRRANYQRLAAALRNVPWATLLYPDLPEGICPLALPLLVERREVVRRHLLASGVNVRAYWEQLPAAVSVGAYGDAHHVANRILVLPVHQSLTPRQMNHLLQALARVAAA